MKLEIIIHSTSHTTIEPVPAPEGYLRRVITRTAHGRITSREVQQKICSNRGMIKVNGPWETVSQN